jgi:hypothetical protein
MPAWKAGSWADDAWAGTAWDESEPTFGRAWFATAWAAGAWGEAAWAAGAEAPDVDWDLEAPTLGPELAGAFSASGDFAWGWGVVETAGAALSATFGASGDFDFLIDDQPFSLAPDGPVVMAATFGASGNIVSAAAGSATVTIRLLDKAEGGEPLPDLVGIQWGWWDDAADEAETWGAMPTGSGTTESTDGTGAIQVSAPSSKSSGQTVLIKLYQHGYPPRAFTGLLTVD